VTGEGAAQRSFVRNPGMRSSAKGQLLTALTCSANCQLALLTALTCSANCQLTLLTALTCGANCQFALLMPSESARPTVMIVPAGGRY
jgi:hypothetical protein